LELEQFARKFPSSIPHHIGQDRKTGRIVVQIFPMLDGVQHEVHLVLSPFHPDHQIDTFVIYPRLEKKYMGHHWYGPNHICYLEYWDRSWTVLKVAVQVMCWLTDYYRQKNGMSAKYYTNVVTLYQAAGTVYLADDVARLLKDIRDGEFD